MNRHEIECVVLNKLINKKSYYYEHFDKLYPALFSDSLNQRIYNIIDSFYQQGKNVDIISLCDALKKDINKDYSYDVASLVTKETFHLDFINCINKLIEFNKSDNLQIIVQELNEVIKHKEISVEDAIELSIKELSSLNDDTSGELPNIQKQIKSFIEQVEENSTKTGITGLTSGFPSIDNHTNGWRNQDLIIVGGASSMGKTSLALIMAHNAAKSNIPTVVFSYEMSVEQLITRLVSSDSEIDNRIISSGKLSTSEWSTMHRSIGSLEQTPLYIDECHNTSLRYLLNRIRRYVISKKVKLVMIDYLQLVNNFTKGRSREQEVSQIARSLKNIAKELDISIIALSQLSRGVEKRQGCRPTLGDLRESGEIEQAADTVILVYRPEYYGFEADENGNNVAGLAEIIFAKGRNVGIGNIFLHFNSNLTKFEEQNLDTNYMKFDG